MIIIRIKDAAVESYNYAIVESIKQYQRDLAMRFTKEQWEWMKKDITIKVIAKLDRTAGELELVETEEVNMKEIEKMIKDMKNE